MPSERAGLGGDNPNGGLEMRGREENAAGSPILPESPPPME